MKSSTIHIRKAILLPLAFALLFLLVFSVSGAFWLQRHQFDENVQQQLNSVQQLFNTTLRNEAEHLNTFIDFVMDDPKIYQAFIARDRQLLYENTSSIFRNIENRHHITHFYFHNLDMTCFLRVHKPTSHGDLIDRFTLKKAKEGGDVSYGIELGPFGTLTLRVVHPWKVNNRLIGYIELGREVEYIIPTMKEILGYDFFFLVNIRHLNRQMWLEGLKISGRQEGSWEEVPRHVIIGRTMEAIPREINNYTNVPHSEKEQLIFKITEGDKKYRGGFSPLRVVSGEDIGEIIALRDFTADVDKQRVSTILVMVCLAVLGILFLLFYFHISRMEKRLIKTHDFLTEEIENRKNAEKELQQHKASLEATVSQRTAELTDMNRLLQIEISERKYAEENLQEAHDKLEERVAERSEALEKTYNQLLHAEKMSAIGKLAASIAHEFNNPIYGIRNVLDGLRKRQNLDERTMDMVNLAVKECDRIAKLTQDLQSFNRPTSGLMILLDVHEAIEDMLLLVKKDFSQKKIKVKKHFADDLPAIQGIPDQIKQVMLNMLNNAGAAMPEGGVITISTEKQQEGVAIRIADTGIGIKPEDMDRIFEPFFSTKPAVKGTGLGLSVSYGIIKRHGGSIEVESSPGKGTTFTILLPFSQQGIKESPAG
ncbi:MAG: ATP-binding protein [Thermodesulfobacteriota bacterium]